VDERNDMSNAIFSLNYILITIILQGLNLRISLDRYLHSKRVNYSSATPGHNNRTAITAKPAAAKPFKIFAGNSTDTEPPAKTPIALANNKAATEPKNTARGWFELPLMAIAAN
jgi:hypothetical protein